MWDRHEPERLEQRIRVESDGTITALSGKIEFGQGIRTAFAQIVADELDVPFERVNVVLGDTDQVPFDFGTFGSHSVAQEAPLLRRAAAFARHELIGRATAKLGLPHEKLDTDAGSVVGIEGGKRASYSELVDSDPLTGTIPDRVAL
ncbi:MAG: aldehyde dehydrogenase, partial [Chloroflexi bacterium]